MCSTEKGRLLLHVCSGETNLDGSKSSSCLERDIGHSYAGHTYICHNYIHHIYAGPNYVGHGHTGAQLFDAIDANGDGTLSRDELLLGLRQRGFNEAEIDGLLRALDVDGHGEVPKRLWEAAWKEAHEQASGPGRSESTEMMTFDGAAN